MKLNRNQILAIVAFLFSCVYIILSLQIMIPPGLTQDLLGSRAFPIGTGILMGLCSVGIFFLPVTREEEEESVGVQGLLRLLPYVLVSVLYVILLPWLGTILTTALFFFVIMNMLSRNRYWKDLLLSLAISVFLWFLFSFVLKIQLPTGILGII